MLGLGSGLILSALIALVLPNGAIRFLDSSVSESQEQTNNLSASSTPQTDSSFTPTTKAPSNNLDSDNASSAFTKASESNQTKNSGPTEKTFTVPAGATAERIGDLLVKEGWIKNKDDFLNLVKQKKLASKFRAGDFNLTTGLTLEEVVNALIK
ncbi:hypothetical protein SPFL3101_02840 [Sporomusaceae bacterium FL31]|nr:hypothetical protein SPFL3101_02840 [Sporomusaceae bacterium FL31]